MDNRFCCYGTYCQTNFRCLIKCQDKEECEQETRFRKWLKYDVPKGEDQNGKDNEGRILFEDC